jgi:predicted PurR-regulated permease PerM
MKFNFDKEAFKKYLYLTLAVLAGLVCYQLIMNFNESVSSVAGILGYIWQVTSPILFGFAIAYFLFRPMRWIQYKIIWLLNKAGFSIKKNNKAMRIVSIFIVYAIAGIFIFIFVNAVIPSITESVQVITHQFSGDENEIYIQIDQLLLTEPIASIVKFFNLDTSLYENLTNQGFQSTITQFLNDYNQYLQSFGESAFDFAKSFINVILNLLISIFIAFYLLMDQEHIFAQLNSFFETTLADRVYIELKWFIKTSDEIFYKYFFGKALCSIFIGLLAYIGFMVIGIPYASLLAVIVGITNMVPYFGPIIGAIPAIIVSFLTIGLWPAIWTAIWMLIVQQFDGNILGPNVLGKIVEINAFWVLFAVTIGGKTFGVLGMLLAIPVFAILKVILSRILTTIEDKRKKSKENMLLEHKEL